MSGIPIETFKELIEPNFPVLARDQHLVEEMALHCTIRDFKKGEIIIDYGQYIKFVPLVVDGLLKILREGEDGQEVLLYFLTAGNSCAASFSCCMIRKRSEIKAICEEDCQLMVIPLEAADRWMSEISTWRNFVLEMYDSRLFSIIDTVDRLAFSKLDEKLWHYLTEKAFLTKTHSIQNSHSEIARDLNASREAISRLLKKLENQGKIKLERYNIELLED
jgi:CRP/FNR family transcriptional regulator